MTVGSSPSALAIYEDGNKVYVANAGSNNVTVIDGATYAITQISSGKNPVALAVDPVSAHVYVANFNGNSLTVIVERRTTEMDLSSLTLSVGSLTPAFDPLTNNYSVNVDNGISTLTVTASTVHEGASIRVGATAYGNSAVVPVTLHVGKNELVIQVQSPDGYRSRGYNLTIYRASGTAPETPTDGGHSTPPNGQGTDSSGITTVPGRLKLAPSTATISVTPDTDGTPVYKAVLHAEPLMKALGMLKDKEQSERVVTFEITGTEQVRQVGIPGQVILDSASLNETFIRIKAANADYSLPTHQASLVSFLQQLGQDQANKAIIYVSMRTITGSDAQRIADHLAEAGIELLGDIVDFTLTVETNGKSYTLSDYGSTYVARSLYLPGTIDASHSTAVVIDPVTGNVSFVPSVFRAADGGTAATIYRNTSSLYAVVRSMKTFADLSGHWAKSDVELLASKQIVKGVSTKNFAPNNNVTRAEFVSLIVRALGLGEEASYTERFIDVSATDWFVGAVGAASKVSIVNGLEDGTFRPGETITREQMAVMLSNALKFAINKFAASTTANV
ncbi:S-layer homology domain-containing protein [Paenibacillus mendelii]|uniref:S-layer homology domain-containing protein n=1 Tax=Paenibacillus mendelii TaxID=206163 RepID=A0ABV6JAN8_9BACL|nr:S-layer homology domain-containing protein [Paenibacillus mendelii]MCQ6563146.1 S-layer homology domain-containing protein [Paenibacillus mendelii]